MRLQRFRGEKSPPEICRLKYVYLLVFTFLLFFKYFLVVSFFCIFPKCEQEVKRATLSWA